MSMQIYKNYLITAGMDDNKSSVKTFALDQNNVPKEYGSWVPAFDFQNNQKDGRG